MVAAFAWHTNLRRDEKVREPDRPTTRVLRSKFSGGDIGDQGRSPFGDRVHVKSQSSGIRTLRLAPWREIARCKLLWSIFPNSNISPAGISSLEFRAP